ncbi:MULTISPECIES: MFS transporter [unclassified Bifidobacterium]|uniref:MFS transporter n=1 Tax=unclassified Bifidobacterium TaxID=2608897 RepID=UPI0023F8C31E|nr:MULTISPECIES: MFS transporter [unclassified Bifidobacterium]WEV65636.1 MFS transporter [Bifidobacterium sp. ESL0764]WEV75580.1 MFS transporter [Bifidobacterium sp. ESL0800]
MSVTRILGLLMPTIIALYGVYQAINQVLLPAQLAQISPSGKVHYMAIASLVESVVGTIILPVGAAISDRTQTKLGKRTPWLLFSAVGTLITCLIMATAKSIPVVVVMAGFVWFFANWYQGVIYAVIPDRIPENYRGMASSAAGLGLPFGILIFVNIAARTSRFVGYAVVGVFIVVTTILFCVFAREDSSIRAKAEIREADKTEEAQGKHTAFFSAFLHRDFTMAFLSRFSFFFANFAVSNFTFYILSDYIGVKNLPSGNVAANVATVSTFSTIAQIIAIIVFGKLADMLDRRKMIVALSSIIYMVSFIVPLVSKTWIGMLIYAVISGAASGVYFAVDIAVMSLVLPSKADEGRDLGILAIATSVPAAVAPLVGSTLLDIFGTYASIFIFGCVTALLGGLFAFMIKSVR